MLCVAHALDTVTGFDRVIVMDAGSIVEIGNPTALLADEGSAFSRLMGKP